jgi:murein DD-endopeptidase MepM/ murein hydrolase activator NlpD
MPRFAVLAQTCSVVAILVLLWLSRTRAPVWSALHAYLLLSAIVFVAWRAIDLIRGRISLLAYRQAKAHWPQLAATLLRVVVWVLIAVAVDVGMPTETFRYQEESSAQSWIAASVLVILALLPRRRRWAPGDVLFGVLLLVVGSDLAFALNEQVDNALDIRSPFERSSYVLNGSASLLVNEHARISGEAWGTDLYPHTRSGRLCQGSGLAAFPCFGAPVLAPVAGRIDRVVSDRPDMPLGEVDEEVPTGNSVSIQTQDGRCLMLAHLKRLSILVREGEDVTVGQQIARCGNSGRASVPHLFLQARGCSVAPSEGAPPPTFPLRFVEALRFRDRSFAEDPFVVRRNDIIYPLPDGEDNEADAGTDDAGH